MDYALTGFWRMTGVEAQKRTAFICPTCNNRVHLDGHIMSVELEGESEIWRSVELPLQ
jgi:hypothetical protein